MAKIVDILVTGIDDENKKNPLQNSIVIKVKTGNKIRNYTSCYKGFYNYDCNFAPEYIEQLIDDAGSISLMKGIDKTFSVYEIDDDYYVILKNQYICLKTKGEIGNQKIVGAFCEGIHACDGEDAYRSYPDVTKFELAKAIANDFAKNFPELKIKSSSKKQNTNE